MSFLLRAPFLSAWHVSFSSSAPVFSSWASGDSCRPVCFCSSPVVAIVLCEVAQVWLLVSVWQQLVHSVRVKADSETSVLTIPLRPQWSFLAC